MEGFNASIGVLGFKRGSWPGGVQGVGGGSQPGWDESWERGPWPEGEVVQPEKRLHGPG